MMNADLMALQESIRPVVDAAGLAAPDTAIWDQATELGWLMTAAPEEMGGLGLGLESMLLVAAEMGHGLVAAPIIEALMAIDACAAAGQAERVDALLAGDTLAVPLTDPQIDARAGSLTGVCQAVSLPASAKELLLWSADATLLCCVPLNCAGLSVTQTPTWDRTRQLASVTCERVLIDDAAVIASGDDATRLINRLLAVRGLLLAADCHGAARSLLTRTIEHLRVRQQFGRPLAMFQALKHRVADLQTALVGSVALQDSTVARIADVLDDEQCGVDASAALAMAQSVFAEVAEEALQLHGGIGMAAEHDCHLFLKRAMLNRQLGRTRSQTIMNVAARLIAEQTG